MQYKLSTTASAATISLWAAYAGTQRGTTWSSTAEPTVDTIASTTDTGTWTVAELNSSSLQVTARVRRTSNTACTYSFDYLAVEVTYTIDVDLPAIAGDATGAAETATITTARSVEVSAISSDAAGAIDLAGVTVARSVDVQALEAAATAGAGSAAVAVGFGATVLALTGSALPVRR